MDYDKTGLNRDHRFNGALFLITYSIGVLTMSMSSTGLFNTPVYVRGCSIGHRWGEYAKFQTREQANFAAYMINNYNLLLNENKHLKEIITQLNGEHLL